jgi:DNA-binding NarL/FixJ family response regulator
MSQERVRVLIVDDHELVRDGLKALLSRDPAIDVVGEASTGLEALELVPRLLPDVALMDLRMPVMDGAEATARIRDAYPRVQVVILSGAGDDALVRAALEGGAISSLVKDARSDAVTQAIHEAAGRGAG